MDQYQHIRHLYLVEGLSQRAIARQLKISRNTVRRYCNGAHVPWERKSSPKKAQVVTPEVIEFIEQCLKEDENALDRRQKHTAKRIYDRLCQEKGFQGGESTIRRVVRELKAKPSKVYVPLSFSPGEAIQVDWGTATVIMAGQKTEVNLFCMRLCFSCAPFVVAYPSQREEAFLEGHKTGFEFFGGVSRDIIYDNLKTAVKEGWGKTAKEQEKFINFRSHYAYHSRFCNPRAGHEKGLVENLVGYIRRNFLVPVPRAENFEELNQLLKKRCLEYVEHHRIKGRDLSVKEAYEMEKQALMPLPVKPYETARTLDAKVDYFSTVTFETNRYSVPVRLAGKTVTVKGSALKIEVYYRGEEVAVHLRSYGHHRTIYQLEHYLPLLKARPRSVFNARPVKEAGLPAELEQYAQKLSDPHRGMVRLLRLAFDHSLVKVLDAVRTAASNGQYSVDVVQYYLNREEVPVKLKPLGPEVEPVDLKAYDSLWAGGGFN